MRPYLATARRYWWLLAIVLALVWGAGMVAGYDEYRSTYSSQATIWVHRAPGDIATTNPDEPNLPLMQTSASQQADLLEQLLETKSFLRDVVRRTSLGPSLIGLPDDAAALEAIGKRFKVQAVGTNLISVTFAGRDPRVAREMVAAALDVRNERVARARIDATTAVGTLYRREFDVAQQKAIEAQAAVETFNANHTAPLSAAETDEWARLRLTLDQASVRVMDLKNRIDQAALAPAVLEVSGLEFQVMDEPREEMTPRGGTKTAAMLAGVAMVAGLALVALLVFVGTVLANHIAGPADVARLGPARLFGTVPRVVQPKDAQGGDLRAGLTAIAFAPRADGAAVDR